MRKKLRRGTLLILLLLAALIAALIFIMERNLKPILLNTAESRVRSVALEAINSAIAVNLSDVHYDDLITVERDTLGRVVLLQANTINMNRISTQTALTAQKYITDIGQQPIGVNLGSATGNALLAGRGPEIMVNVIPVGAVGTEFITEFQSTGINQTRHKVYIRICAMMRIVIPNGAKEVEVVSQLPVAETVIVGDVPGSYVNVESTEDMLNLLPELDD